MSNIAEALKPLAVPVDSVRPDPRNARAHDERNINTIRKSLEVYGQRKPIVVNHDGIIEAGNGLYQAAKELKWTEIAVVKVKDDADYAKGFGVMDNKSAELAEWSLPDLKDVLEGLDTGAFDMELTGFNEAEIEELMTQFHVEEADMPELQTGDKAGFQQMTFTLSDEQAGSVSQAIKKSKGMGDFESTGNENSNGNALARVCELFNGQC